MERDQREYCCSFGGLVLNAQDEVRGAIIMLISGSGRVVFLSVILQNSSQLDTHRLSSATILCFLCLTGNNIRCYC